MLPNPTSGRVELIFNAEKAMEIEVGIADLSGRAHMRGQFFQCTAGRNVIMLDLAEKGLAPGMYVVTARGGSRVIRKKVIYQPALKP